MGASFSIKNTKEVQRMFAQAVKKSKRSAECAFEDVTLLAHETAKKRATSRKIRPFWKTGNYTRSIAFSISKKGTFTGKIFSPVLYAGKLEGWYQNLQVSADTAIKSFKKFMTKCYRTEMRKKR